MLFCIICVRGEQRRAALRRSECVMSILAVVLQGSPYCQSSVQAQILQAKTDLARAGLDWGAAKCQISTINSDKAIRRQSGCDSHLPQIDEVIGRPPVAGDGEVAGLGVQGEQGQVHGAAQGEGDLRGI